MEESGNHKLLDSVSWDLCSTYFTLAKNLRDNFEAATLDCIDEVKQEIISLLSKSLKHCVPPECHHSNDEQPLSTEELDFLREKYLSRMSEIHQHLGSLYHHSFRFDPLANKSCYAMSEMHYSKAAECCIFQVAKSQPSVKMSPKKKKGVQLDKEQKHIYVHKQEHDSMFAQVQLERTALIEVQLTGMQIPA